MAESHRRPQYPFRLKLIPLIEPGNCVFCGGKAHYAVGVRRYYLACETHYWDWFHSGYDALCGSWKPTEGQTNLKGTGTNMLRTTSGTGMASRHFITY